MHRGPLARLIAILQQAHPLVLEDHRVVVAIGVRGIEVHRVSPPHFVNPIEDRMSIFMG